MERTMRSNANKKPSKVLGSQSLFLTATTPALSVFPSLLLSVRGCLVLKTHVFFGPRMSSPSLLPLEGVFASWCHWAVVEAASWGGTTKSKWGDEHPLALTEMLTDLTLQSCSDKKDPYF